MRSVRPLSPDSEVRLEKILLGLVTYYKYRGVNLRTSCEDFDRHHIGVINETQVGNKCIKCYITSSKIDWFNLSVVNNWYYEIYLFIAYLFFGTRDYSSIEAFHVHRKFRNRKSTWLWGSTAILTERVWSTIWTCITTSLPLVNATRRQTRRCTTPANPATSWHRWSGNINLYLFTGAFVGQIDAFLPPSKSYAT